MNSLKLLISIFLFSCVFTRTIKTNAREINNVSKNKTRRYVIDVSDQGKCQSTAVFAEGFKTRILLMFGYMKNQT